MIQRFGMLVWPDGSPEWLDADRYPDTAARTTAYEMFDRLDQLDPIAIGAQVDRFEVHPVPEVQSGRARGVRRMAR